MGAIPFKCSEKKISKFHCTELLLKVFGNLLEGQRGGS